MNDDQRIERLLQARPPTDPVYQPGIVHLLDMPSDRQTVVGTLGWRHGPVGATRPVALILLGAAILMTAAVMLVGGSPTNELVVVPPSPTIATPEPVQNFPTVAVTDVLERFETSRWAGTPNVLIEAAVVRGERMWLATSRQSAYTSPASDSRPGNAAIRIGSLTRLRNVAIALRLVDEGRLDLDAPISRYVSSWPSDDAITVRNLLDASSGVASYGEPIEDLARLVAAEPSRTWTAADALRLARDKSPRFQPGDSHKIVDTEDALLVEIIEAITGSPVEEVYSELFGEIAPPLPVDVVPSASPIPGHFNLVAGLWDTDRSGTLVEVSDLPDDVVAVLGPARDWAIPITLLARLTDDIHTHPSLLSGVARATLDETFEDGGFGGSAMCPCTGDAKNGVGLIGHTGPYTSLAVYVPSERLTIAIVANVAISNHDLAGLLQEIHDRVWPAIR